MLRNVRAQFAIYVADTAAVPQGSDAFFYTDQFSGNCRLGREPASPGTSKYD